MLFLWTTHIRPLLEYGSCVWNTGYLTDLALLERVQRRWTKKISGLENLCYSERLNSLNLYSVQGRLLRADLIQHWKVLNHKSCIHPDNLFTLLNLSSTRGHCLKLYHPTVATDVRKRLCNGNTLFIGLSSSGSSSTLPCPAAVRPRGGSPPLPAPCLQPEARSARRAASHRHNSYDTTTHS